MGVILVTNPIWFNSDKKGSPFYEQELETSKLYHHYYLGALFAILFAIFSGMNMVTIRDMGGNMYVSLKTYYFGVLSTIVSFIICIIVDPSTLYIWRIWTGGYTITLGSFTGSFIVGVFSWMS